MAFERTEHQSLLTLASRGVRLGLLITSSIPARCFSSHWVRPRYNFFLPVKAMAKVFRGKFLDALRKAFTAGELHFPGQLKNFSTPRAFSALLRQCCRHKWVVYAKRPFGGPEHVLQYLGNYTHRIAISNHRLVELANEQVSFRWRDSAHNNKKRVMTLRVEEFLRRFFLHVLPAGSARTA